MASGPRNAGGTARTRAPLSCTIICYDEEEGIRAALESVKWCDEIVVVDSFSTDRTVEICREYTDRIFQREWPGFVEQKAFALEQTRCAWVLNLDADERVSPELRREIEEVLRDPDADGYYVPRLVYYLGRWWRRGGWYPDYRLRLFRRDKVVWGGIDPHEKVILHGRSRRLRGPLLHYTYRDVAAPVARRRCSVSSVIWPPPAIAKPSRRTRVVDSRKRRRASASRSCRCAFAITSTSSPGGGSRVCWRPEAMTLSISTPPVRMR